MNRVSIDRRIFSSLFFAGALVASIRPLGAATSARLLFVHGRGQAGLKADELKASWLAALSEGAAAVGGVLPQALEAAFPFYGDVLERFVSQADLPMTGDLQARGGAGQDPDFLVFQAEVAQALRAQSGVTDEEILSEYQGDPRARGPLNWKWVQAIFRAIDKQGGGLSGAAIEQFTRDVYLYTTRENIQKAVDDVIRADLTTTPTIVVAHSLGTVAAYNVLRNDARTLQIPLFVTLGSPLGIRAIRDKLMPLTFPKNTSSWYNAYDARDVVALYPLDEANFPVKAASIANFGGVRNHTSNRHGIAGYLDDKHVARRLLDSLQS